MTSSLFQQGQRFFQTLIEILVAHQVDYDENIKLLPGEQLFCFYSLDDGQIYLSVPDDDTPASKLQCLLLKSLLGCETNAELIRVYELFLPWTITHEIAHHLRHRAHMFSDDWRYEEFVANQLAIAIARDRLPALARRFLEDFLQSAMAHLRDSNGLTHAPTSPTDPASYLYIYLSNLYRDLTNDQTLTLADFVQQYLRDEK
jgi:hypothetical protein